MSTEQNELVALSIEGHIATVTLNDPDRLNALSVPMGDTFEAVIKRLQTSDIRALVLTGAGRAFSAGGDLAFLKARIETEPKENQKEMLAFYKRFLSILSLEIPLIAAINGHAIGAGFSLAMACDHAFVAKKAKLGANFVRLGLHPGMGASEILPAKFGAPKAALLLQSGRIISGVQAATYGLCLEALETEEVLQSAQTLAKEFAEQSPIAVKATTQTLRARTFANLENALLREAEEQAKSYASKDYALGIDALLSRQSPRY